VLATRFVERERHGGGVLACANHLAGFCGAVDVLTFLGEGGDEEAFVRRACKPNVTPRFVYKDASPTIVKKRYVEKYLGQKLFEVYSMNDAPFSDEADAEFGRLLRKALPQLPGGRLAHFALAGGGLPARGARSHGSSLSRSSDYVLKLDSAGAFVWAQQFDNVYSSEASIAGIAVDGNGNVLTTMTQGKYGSLFHHPLRTQPLADVPHHVLRRQLLVAGLQRDLALGEADVIGPRILRDHVKAVVARVRLRVHAQKRGLAAQQLDRLRAEHVSGQAWSDANGNMPGDLQTILANCLSHGRRTFYELADVFPSEVRHVLEIFKQVYKIDAKAKMQELSPEDRLRLHQQESRPLMDELRQWLDEQFDERKAEPNSSLGKAIAYMRKHWEKLTLFLRVAGAPLDNNICERALKKAWSDYPALLPLFSEPAFD